LLSSLELDSRLRELAILRVGRLERAEYEWVQHVPIARAVGASDEEIAAIERGDLDDGALDEQTRAVLAFTTEAVQEVRASDGAGLPYGVSRPVQHAVRMSDGTRLAVDVYYPTNLRTGAPASGRFPVLLSMTPYGKRSSVTTQATGGSTYGGDGFYPWLVRHG